VLHLPIRIYALAKDLKIDSKELADLCVKAGIPGKGSALASLDDDEVVRLKAYLTGPAFKPAAAPPPLVDTRAPIVPVRTSIPVLPPTPPPARVVTPPAPEVAEKSAATPEVERPVEPAVEVGSGVVTAPEPPPATPAVVATASAPPTPKVPPASVPVAEILKGRSNIGAVVSEPVAKVPKGRAPAPAAPAAPVEPIVPAEPAAPTPYGRDDYMPPSGGTRRIPVLDTRTRRAATTEKGEGGEGPARTVGPKKREPVINLAKMPDVKQPTAQPKSHEPPAQKPDLRLPKDAIRGAKAGTRPPLEHLTQKADQRKAKPPGSDRSGPPLPRGAGGKAPPMEAPLEKAAARGGRKVKGPETEQEKELAGMASARADRQKARKVRQQERGVAGGPEEFDDRGPRRSRRLTRRSSGVSTAAPRKEAVALELPCSVRQFSEATGVQVGQLLKRLMALGSPMNINAMINQEMAELLAAELGLDVELKQQASLEDDLLTDLAETEDSPESLVPRPPVVTFLGHVDHGKTSLLDRLIGINVAAREAGGITQHIRAYEITKGDRKIAFVDTPGHEAFTEMRARGANVTDIAVLVVAADDGVMPQTEEAISHAKAAGVPIVVALNKMDLPGANADRVLQQLAAQGLVPSEWSGDVEVVRCSAITGQGMDELLETLLLTADLNEYKANPSRRAVGVCLEAEQEAGRGVIAKLMVKNGTLEVGDVIVCGGTHGRVKAMFDTLHLDRRLKKAGPSTPVNVTGLDAPPQAGDAFHVLEDIGQARDLAASRQQSSRATSLSGQTARVSFQQFQQLLSDGRVGEKKELQTLNLILRADVRGSIEAIQKELSKFSHPEVAIRVLQASVGAISVADVTLGQASDAVIIGFNVIPDEAARALAEERQVEIRRYDIIYKVADDIKAMIEGKLKPEERVVELGQALVKQTFQISRVGTVAGCYVARGTIERGCRLRIYRDGRQIGDYLMDSLKREKDDVKEVMRGMECGIRLAGFNDIKKDDVFEAYRVEEVARTL